MLRHALEQMGCPRAPPNLEAVQVPTRPLADEETAVGPGFAVIGVPSLRAFPTMIWFVVDLLIVSTLATCGIGMTPLPIFVVGEHSCRPRSLCSSWKLPKSPGSIAPGPHREPMRSPEGFERAVYRNTL
jgi:hypothetical protein